MLSFAGGLAREGFIPFVHTFAVFIYRRAYDQIIDSIAYPCLPVKMFGFLPGVTTPGGASHQAIEDLSLMRAVPNMTVVEVGDATEIESLLDPISDVEGPVYIRMLRGEIPRLFPADQGFRLGKARKLQTGSDVTILSTGICTEEASRATAVIQLRGVSVEHLHVSTLKPFDDPAVMDALAKPTRGVVTIENHTIIGGLGSATAEAMAAIGAGHRLLRIGIQDQFLHGASRAYLMKKYHLDAISLVRAVESLVGEDLHIGEDDLVAARVGELRAVERTEDL
jgi:transketolase